MLFCVGTLPTYLHDFHLACTAPCQHTNPCPYTLRVSTQWACGDDATHAATVNRLGTVLSMPACHVFQHDAARADTEGVQTQI